MTDIVYPLVKLENSSDVNPSSYFFCNICGEDVLPESPIKKNLRDNIKCGNCKSINRQRQLTCVLLDALKRFYPLKKIKSISQLSRDKPHLIYNTESNGALHRKLNENMSSEYYYHSEFVDSELKSGVKVNETWHQDLQNLSFTEDTFDFILSSEVFEHIPSPYKAFEEVYRTLKKGGKHIFTVPFDHLGFCDDKRAEIFEGEIKHLKKPIYHGDPMNPANGILVFNIFSIEMLVKLSKLGFHTRFYRFFNPEIGIYGNNAIVFESTKL